MKKRICGLLLALLLLFSLVPLSAAADATALTASGVSVAHGTAEKTVSISVGISGNPGIAAFDFSVSGGAPLAFQGVALASALGSDYYSINNAHVTYVDGTEYSGSSLFTVTYSVPANAAVGSYPVTVEIEAYRLDETPVIIPPKTVYVNVTHDLVQVDADPATCEKDGAAAYWICSGCGAKFADANGQTEITAPKVIPKLEHDWNAPVYEWTKNGDTWKCTATRTCRNGDHPETETVNAASIEKTPATCGAVGTTTYTATFTNAAFAEQTKDENDIPATGAHTWSEPAWNWAGNDTVGYTEAAATFECTVCHDDGVKQTIPVVPQKVHNAYCDAEGSDVYTAKVTGPDGVEYTDSKTVVLAAIGHEWTVKYDWANWVKDSDKVNVIFICANGDHPVQTQADVALKAGAEDTYVATLEALPDGVTGFDLPLTDEHTYKPFLLGDVNGDGEVNRKDSNYLAKALARWNGYSITNPLAADVNKDGEVNRKDSNYLAKALARWSGYTLT